MAEERPDIKAADPGGPTAADLGQRSSPGPALAEAGRPPKAGRAGGSEPGDWAPGPVRRLLDAYNLPRAVPVVVRLAIWLGLLALPWLLWLVFPHGLVVAIVLGVLEVAIVVGGLSRIFTSAELTR